MDYKKLHKDTIAKLQEMVNSGKITVETACGICADFVPESEDERIRRKIIQLVNDAIATNAPYKKEMLFWLEKQGEHANFRNKIQIGDQVTKNQDGVLVNLSQLNRVAKKQTEQKLYVNDNAKEMFIKALERVEEQNNKGYKLTDCDKNSWWEDFKTYTSCTVEQKPAWSEEDERKINYLIALLQNSTMNDDALRVMNEEVENWLKSLRPQNRWKPNEEQMDALRYVTNFDYGGHKATLVSLYEQLKKLK